MEIEAGVAKGVECWVGDSWAMGAPEEVPMEVGRMEEALATTPPPRVHARPTLRRTRWGPFARQRVYHPAVLSLRVRS